MKLKNGTDTYGNSLVEPMGENLIFAQVWMLASQMRIYVQVEINICDIHSSGCGGND